MAEELRLEATVVDRFSKPLTDLSNKLRGIRSPDGLRAMRKDFDGAQASMARLASTIDSQVGRSLGGMAMQIGGIIASFYSATQAIQRFTNEVPKIAMLSRETGVAANNIRALAAVGKQLQIDGVEGGISKFSENLYDAMRKRGTMWVELLKVAPNLAEQMRQAGVVGDIDKAISIALDAVADIRRTKGAVAAQRYAELIFGNKDFARFGELTREQLKEEIAAAQKRSQLSKEAEDRAGALRKSFNDLNTSLGQLSDTTMSKLAPGLIELVKATERLVAAGSKLDGAFVVPLNAALQAMEGIARVLNGDKGALIGALLGAIGGGAVAGPGGAVAGALAGAYAGGRAGDAIDGNAQSKLDDARQRLAAMDKWLGRNGGDSSFRRNMMKNRAELEEEIRRMEKAVKEGVKEGIKESTGSPGMQKSGFQNAALTPGGGVGGDGGGGRGTAPHWQAVPNGDAAGGQGGGRAGPYVPGAPSSGVSPPGSLTKLIDEEAKRAGINPAIMHGIRAGESLKGSKYDVKDDRVESSWGPFQLNRRRGLGVEFERDTAEERKRLGYGDLRDPRTIGLQAKWVADYIARNGPRALKHWMGYRGPRNADPRWGNSGYVPGDGGGASGTLTSHPSRNANSPMPYPYEWAPGRWPAPGALAQQGQQAGVFGGLGNGSEGKASLDVTLNGFPSGWKARAEGGGLFKDVNVARGRSMVAASEE